MTITLPWWIWPIVIVAVACACTRFFPNIGDFDIISPVVRAALIIFGVGVAVTIVICLAVVT